MWIPRRRAVPPSGRSRAGIAGENTSPCRRRRHRRRSPCEWGGVPIPEGFAGEGGAGPCRFDRPSMSPGSKRVIAAIKARLRDLRHDSGPAEEPSAFGGLVGQIRSPLQGGFRDATRSGASSRWPGRRFPGESGPGASAARQRSRALRAPRHLPESRPPLLVTRTGGSTQGRPTA